MRLVGLAASAVALLALAACTSSNGGNKAESPAAHDSSVPSGGSTASTPGGEPTGSVSSSSTASDPAIITTSATTSSKISPAQPVTVGIAHGKLTAVTMTNPAGKKVTGQLATDGTSWHNTEALGYSKTYKIVATGVDQLGAPVTRSTQVTTLTPGNETMA
jgi:hypothetical protein